MVGQQRKESTPSSESLPFQNCLRGSDIIWDLPWVERTGGCVKREDVGHSGCKILQVDVESTNPPKERKITD